MDSTTPTRLRITIVGAGIGGLSAAIFLRQQGHHVTILEQSSFANELGAAVHLAPNANGLLRRMGLIAEETGANPALLMTQYLPNGKELFTVDLEQAGKMWQHKWLLAHRVHIHAELRKRATAQEGKGKKAELRTSSKVMDVDNKGRVTLANGEVIEADLVVGADGVHSQTRGKLPGAKDFKPFGSGKSAFRFVMQRSKALSDEDTKPLVEKPGHLQMFFAKDRRIVIYPTYNNELLNFVCIHPTAESKNNPEALGEWQQQGQMSNMLEVYKDFAPNVVKLLSMAEEETLKVWVLLDMEDLPTWTDERLVCIGDAAHPFTPHQGQGAGQAIEDAASLAVVLPLGTPASDIPERLKLYQKCRYERATKIQEFSRIAGMDLGSGPPIDAQRFTAYNFGHDEWDYSTQQLRLFLQAKKPDIWQRMPISFGPMPRPRQDVSGNARNGTEAIFTTASIKFRTSRTLLQNLFPTAAFKFSSPATNVLVTFSTTTLNNLSWLGGKGYSHFGLYIHGVEHIGENGETTHGSFLSVLFENLADPIISGREELGMPKLWSELNVTPPSDENADWTMTAGWLGEQFCSFSLTSLVEDTESTRTSDSGEDLMWYKYIPRSGQTGSDRKRHADAEHAVSLPKTEETIRERRVEKVWKGTGSLSFDALDPKRLPTLHHIVERLAEIPIYEVLEAKIEKGRGVEDVRQTRQI